MPRSGPGLATGWLSSSTRPVVGVSSPATMRSSVDLPQPDGPRMAMKSLSSTLRSVRLSASVGGPPCTPGGADDQRHHQDDLKHRADEDHRELLLLADAGPQDQQRNEGRGGQIAREGHERLEEGLDRLERAHQDAERYRDERREDEAAH